MRSGMSVLVVGATGIIGQELCAEAITSGHQVFALSRGHRPISGSSGLGTPTRLVADVRDPAAIRSALGDSRFDVVVDLLSFKPAHLASMLDVVGGRCGQYIFVSSATVYGGANLPAAIVESSPRIHGPWTYPALKLQCEDLLAKRCRETQQSFTVVRPYITYSEQRVAFGAWEGDVVLPRLLGGRPTTIGSEFAQMTTSLTHATDVARGMVALMGNPAAVGEDFLIASEEQVTWTEIFELSARVVGTDLHLVQVPTQKVLQTFPELYGKIADRNIPRAFDSGKLKRACPDFSFTHSVAAGYELAIRGLLALGPLRQDIRTQGRVDRLIASADPGALGSRPYAAAFSGSSPLNYARYAAGRYGSVSRLRQMAKRLRVNEQRGRNDYGIG